VSEASLSIPDEIIAKALNVYWETCAAGPREPAMRAAILVALQDVAARHDKRVTELLAANNAMLEAKRQAEAAAEKASDLCATALRLIELVRERGVEPLKPFLGESGGQRITLLDTWTVPELGELPAATVATLGESP
jgi:acyl-CoA reductase-like NAD-dependent aldehyde dehydrogenase